jgi:hypothetical protein
MEGVRIYQAPNWPEVKLLPGTGTSSSAASRSYCAFSPDGGLLAVIVGQSVIFKLKSGIDTSSEVLGDCVA